MNIFKSLVSWPRRVAATSVAAALIVSIVTQPADAQGSFPNRPVTLVVPFTAGGATDVVARMLAEEVGKLLGQTMVVENRVGAAGAVGGQFVARSAPDGYTLCFCGSGPSVLLKLLDPKLPYNPAQDFAPITLTHTLDFVVLVPPSSPFKTLKDMVAAAKARPGELSYASSGIGGPVHLGMEYFNRIAGIKMNHIPYKGESAEVVDLVAGRVEVAPLTLQLSEALIKTGKVRPLAVWTKDRSKMLPEIPAVSEDYKGFDAAAFIGIMAAAGTPAPIIDKLQKAFVQAVSLPNVQRKLIDMGFSPRGTTTAEFVAFLQEENVRWGKLIQELGLKGRTE